MKQHHILSTILTCFLLLGLVGCTPPTINSLTAEEGAELIKTGRVTQIEVTADSLYLILDDRTQARVPRADTPEGGLLAPFQPYEVSPVDLLNVPIVPREE